MVFSDVCIFSVAINFGIGIGHFTTSIVTTLDVVISDVVIVATSEVLVSPVLTAGGLSTSGPRK